MPRRVRKDIKKRKDGHITNLPAPQNRTADQLANLLIHEWEHASGFVMVPARLSARRWSPFENGRAMYFF